LTPTSGDPSSATRKAPATHPRSADPARTPPKKAVTKRVQPAAAARNTYPRRRIPALIPGVTHIHAGRPQSIPAWSPSIFRSAERRPDASEPSRRVRRTPTATHTRRYAAMSERHSRQHRRRTAL
jgi:hypothetical protein